MTRGNRIGLLTSSFLLPLLSADRKMTNGESLVVGRCLHCSEQGGVGPSGTIGALCQPPRATDSTCPSMYRWIACGYFRPSCSLALSDTHKTCYKHTAYVLGGRVGMGEAQCCARCEGNLTPTPTPTLISYLLSPIPY